MMKKFLIVVTMSLFATSVAAEEGCVKTGNGELRCGTIILK